MIKPSILLLILNQNVSNAPRNNEEAASIPHKNAVVILPPTAGSADQLAGACTA
jgi:hypothetical protein